MSCACHDAAHHVEHLEPDPYARSEWYCQDAMEDCPRCRWRGPRAPDQVDADAGCAFCQTSVPVRSRPEWLAVYKARVRPLLPWHMVRSRVEARARDGYLTFAVRSPTHGDSVFHVSPSDTYMVTPEGSVEELS